MIFLTKKLYFPIVGRRAAFCLLAVFLPLLAAFSAAATAAPVHELSSFNFALAKNDSGEEILRIEIGISQPPADFQMSADKLRPKKLIIDLENTRMGEIRPAITLDGKFARFLTVREQPRKATQIVVNFARPLKEQAHAVYLAEPDRKSHKPYRLVIDIAEPRARNWDAASTALHGKNIVIDPGHGGSDRGASGPSGLREKDVNLAVARYLAERLKKAGANVRMTRSGDNDVYGPHATDRQELSARVAVGRQMSRLDAFLSIHCDAYGNRQANGTGTFYYPKTFDDIRLAQCLQNAMVRHVNRRDRGIKEANFFVVKYTTAPAALVELAFISNYLEERLLASDEFQQKMANALAEGLAEFFLDAPERERPLKKSAVNLDRKARAERLAQTSSKSQGAKR